MYHNTKKITWIIILTLVLAFVLASCNTSPAAETPTDSPPLLGAGEEPLTAEGAPSSWSTDPAQNTVVSNLGGEQALPRIVATESGEFFITWFSNPDGKNFNVRMQKYDVNGNAQWGENGRIISDHPSNTWISDYVFTQDDEGNLVLIFQDLRGGENSDIYAYKFSPAGDPLWGEDGIPVTNNAYSNYPNGAYATTPESIVFLWEHDKGESSELVLQKLALDGTKVWGDKGAVLPGQDEKPYIQGAIISAGEDEFILVYGIEDQPGSQIMSLFAQKLDGDGNFVWDAPIKLHETVPFYIRPAMVSDEAGGAYISWFTTELHGFVQHLDANGNLLMPEGGAPLVATGTNLQVDLQLQFSSDANELYIFWTDTSELQNTRGMSGQKMSPTGELLWGETGHNYVPLSRGELSQVIPHLTHEHVLVFFAHGEDRENENVFGARLKAILVDADGNPILQEPTVLASLITDKSDLSVAEIRDKEWVAVWQDGVGDGDNYTRAILMQNLVLEESSEEACDDMKFVQDLTLADHDLTKLPQVAPGEKLQKGWRVRNNGTCEWTGSYFFKFVRGNNEQAQMQGQPAAIQGTVKPGAEYDLYVDLVAPQAPGKYVGYWQMFNAENKPFGQTIWVAVEVVSDEPTKTPAPQPTATEQPVEPTATEQPLEPTATEQPPEPTATQKPGADLLYYKWVLSSYLKNEEDAQQSPPLAEPSIKLSFEPDDTFNGNAGCNTYEGNYSTDGIALKFPQISSSMSNCDEPDGIMEQEGRYLQLLEEVESYRIVNDKLEMIKQNGNGQEIVLLTFERKNR